MRSWTDGLIVSHTRNCSLGLSKGECLVNPMLWAHAKQVIFCKEAWLAWKWTSFCQRWSLVLDHLGPWKSTGISPGCKCYYLTTNVHSVWKTFTSSRNWCHFCNIPYEVSTLSRASSKERKVLEVPNTLALDYGYHTYVLKELRYMCNKIRKMIVSFGTK